MAISGGVYTVGESGSSYLRGLKTAVSVLGIGNGFMAEPYQSLTENDREHLGRVLSEVQTLLN